MDKQVNEYQKEREDVSSSSSLDQMRKSFLLDFQEYMYQSSMEWSRSDLKQMEGRVYRTTSYHPHSAPKDLQGS